MITDVQRAERINYLGSTDASAVLGLSPWKTALAVWAEKTGEIEPEDISDKLQVKLGNKMEGIVADLFMEETGKAVRRVNETIYHPKHKFLAANIDRRVVGENAILEIKTTSAWRKKGYEGDEIPPECLVQVHHQLMVTGMPKAYICVLIGNEELKIKEIPRDEKLLKDIEKRLVEFWMQFVQPKVMPKHVTAGDTDTLAKLFPQAVNVDPVQLPDSAGQLIEFLDGYKRDAKQLEKTIDETENQLKLLLGKNEAGITPSGAVVKWSNSTDTRLNGKALLAAYPAIHAEFYKSKPIRRFGYSLKKGEK